MKTIIVLSCLAAAIYAQEEDFQLAQDDQGEEYVMVPLRRFRRGLDIENRGSGTRVTVGHGGNLYDGPVHRIDGSAFASKTFRPTGPLTVGGQLNYTHKPSGSGLTVGAQHTRHFGTDVSAGAKLNLYTSPNGRTTLGATGGWQRHYGGPYGTGRPSWGAMLNFNHRF